MSSLEPYTSDATTTGRLAGRSAGSAIPSGIIQQFALFILAEATNDGVKVTTTGERADGTPINGSYTAKYDGKEYPVTGAPYDSIAIKQVNANTFTIQKNSGTKYNTTTRAVISTDGKTITVTVRGTGTDGSRVSNTMVYDKQ